MARQFELLVCNQCQWHKAFLSYIHKLFITTGVFYYISYCGKQLDLVSFCYERFIIIYYFSSP